MVIRLSDSHMFTDHPNTDSPCGPYHSDFLEDAECPECFSPLVIWTVKKPHEAECYDCGAPYHLDEEQ